jgi:hypothetical protein
MPTLKQVFNSEYRVWQSAKRRCYNPNSIDYHNYGKRGIVMCDRWLHSFPNFIKDMGPKPSYEYTLDRKENNGNYEPNNCKWATRKEQRLNTREEIDKEKRYVIYQLYKSKMKYKNIAEMFNLSIWQVIRAINRSRMENKNVK